MTARERELTSYLVVGGITGALLVAYLCCALINARHKANAYLGCVMVNVRHKDRYPEGITGREYMIEMAGYDRGFSDGRKGIENGN